MKLKIYFSIIALLLVSFTYAQQGVLDGKQFKIVLMKGGVEDSKEMLTFDKGMMDPINCHQWGFTATEYQAKSTAGLQTFRTICKSEKEGTMAWQGQVTGDNIEGSVVWTKEGQSPITYTFKGKAFTPEK